MESKFKNVLKNAALAAGVSVSVLSMAGAAEARELRFASGATQNSIGSESLEGFAAAIEEYSDGELQLRVFLQSLLSFMETPSGLRDGLADFGSVLLPYFPGEFPSTILLTEMTMLLEASGATPEQTAYAFSGAISEFVFEQCPECLDEFANQNQVFIGASGTTPYMLICNTPVRTAEEFRGKRIRTGGPQWSRWTEELGGRPTSMSVSEVYEGLGQGVIDCTAHNAPDMTSFSFIDVTSDVTTQVPGGGFGGIGTHMNADSWRGLSPEHREAIMRASARIHAKLPWLYVRDHNANMELVEERDDISVHEPDQEFINRTREFIEQDMERVAQRYSDRYNVNRAEEMVEEFSAVLDRWVELVDGTESLDELSEIYWDEVFSKVDVTSFGM